MKRLAWIASVLLLSAASASAYAQNAYVTANLNLRSAPDPDYPLITTLRAGTPVSVQGCIDDFLWCDVIAYGERGWVAGDYLEYDYDNRRVLLPSYGARIGIPIISFVIGDYWGRHYSHRSFYSHRNDWYHRPIHYRYVRHDNHDRWDDHNGHGRNDRWDGRNDHGRHDDNGRRDVRHDSRDDHRGVRQNVRFENNVRVENRDTRVVRHDSRQAVPVARRATPAQAPRTMRSGENSGVRTGQRGNAHAAMPQRQQAQPQAAPQRASSERKSRSNEKSESDERGDHDKSRH